MPDLSGQTFGRYHILEPLGEGGMATVYKAYDTRLERDVAIKVIRKDAVPPSQLDSLLIRFEREAKSLARLSHPNIVPVIDYGDQAGTPYLVMAYLPGGTLKEKLGKPLPWRDAVRLLLPVAGALAYAHEKNLIHRDVKPSNILLTQKGQPMLTDFGIAKILEADSGQTLTGTGVGIGTPEYMAPEQWYGISSPQSDIYSLGVVLYELVTGHKPYVADTPAAVLLKQANEPLPRPRQFIPDLPEAVEKVIIKAMAKQPADRYTSMDDFCAAIEGLVAVGQAETMTEVITQAPQRPAPSLAGQTIVDQQPLRPDGQSATVYENVAESQAGEHLAIKPSAAQNKREARKRVPRRASPWYLWLGGMVLLLLALFGAGWILKLFPDATRQPTATRAAIAAASSTAPAQPAVIPTEMPTLTPWPTNTPFYTALDCFRTEVLCVGLVTDVGKVDDRSFNQSAWEGLLDARKNGFADFVEYIETTDVKKVGGNIENFVNARFDVIVTTGFALTDATYAAALKYPRIMFIGIDQDLARDSNHPDWPLPNLVGLVFQEDQSGFLVGALSAMMSKSHKISAVCGTNSVPAVWRFGEGFRAGAAYIDAKNGINTEVVVGYHNDVDMAMSFSDPAWGAQLADAMIDRGVDIVFGCGGNTGNGAIIQAAKRGVYVIGVDTDQFFTLHEVASKILSSAVKLETEPVSALIGLVRNGQFPSTGRFIGPAGYAPYHNLANRVPADVNEQMKAIQSALRDGSLKTNVLPAKPNQ